MKPEPRSRKSTNCTSCLGGVVPSDEDVDESTGGAREPPETLGLEASGLRDDKCGP